MAYKKPDSDLIKSPIEELCGDPDSYKKVENQSEPGWPQRTKSPNAAPERQFDDTEVPKGRG